MKIVYSSGTFDLFHIGHLNVLRKSKALGDYLVVGVSTDELVASYKVKAPIICYDDRAEIISPGGSVRASGIVLRPAC